MRHDLVLRGALDRARRRRRQVDMKGVRQVAVTDGCPQLIQQVLRQAYIDTGDEHVGAQTFQLLDARAERFLALTVRHKIAGRPDAGSRPIVSAKISPSHTILPLRFAHTPHGRRYFQTLCDPLAVDAESLSYRRPPTTKALIQRMQEMTKTSDRRLC